MRSCVDKIHFCPITARKLHRQAITHSAFRIDSLIIFPILTRPGLVGVSPLPSLPPAVLLPDKSTSPNFDIKLSIRLSSSADTFRDLPSSLISPMSVHLYWAMLVKNPVPQSASLFGFKARAGRFDCGLSKIKPTNAADDNPRMMPRRLNSSSDLAAALGLVVSGTSDWTGGTQHAQATRSRRASRKRK